MKIVYTATAGIALAVSLLIFGFGIHVYNNSVRYYSHEQAKFLLHSALVLCAHDYEAQSKPESVAKTLPLHGGVVKYGLKKIDSSTVYIIVSSEFRGVSLSREYIADINLKPY
jgi:hypothetical protein